MYNLLISFFVMAIAASFLCSLLEAVLLSITPTYAQLKLQEGSVIGRHLEAFKSNIDRPLAAILTLNTIAHTVGAIGVGDQAAKIWADANPMITGVVIPTIMVLAILILSEIIPKTLGANHWQKLVPFTVSTLQVIIFLLYPLVWFSQIITRTLKKDKSQSVFKRSEFLAMAELGVTEGIVEKQDSEIIGNLLRMEKVRVKDIMTPRIVVRLASEKQTIKEFYKSAGELPFSRIPLYEGENNEHISGYFLKPELLESLVQGKGDCHLSTIKRDIHVVHESLRISDMFDHFIERREHIALVVDEYGGMAGIVSMEDVMETLLGMEITDESDSTVDMQVLARKKWEQRARRIGLIEENTELPES
ncbi:MAG: CNNM domain-containing protein [Xanthomonadales bacterium]|nr:CNNM domain-containing protein [Xanthomonadales bacterium]